ncbi:protein MICRORCHIDIA 6-like isoform X2 [Coffea arabica]|uniref:Protein MICRORCHIDIA 6-like isoform X2 n=1 Tax=Coffea arabica TaxID=13443 RepID=A0ABM4U4E6_COFAR
MREECVDLVPQTFRLHCVGKESEENKNSSALSAGNSGTSAVDEEQSLVDDSSLCSTSPIGSAPLCRQFWKAGSYDDTLSTKPSLQKGANYLHIHPKFLHSNATSHKWAFGAIAELLDNAIDEIQNGATVVIVDKILNPRDGSSALCIQDDGGGMDPEAMRRCLSFGFSDKKSNSAIGQYGNGFKTSSMRLGADVIVFSRCKKNRKLTQSVGLLSYTFLTQTGHDRIVVPMLDYEFNTQSNMWDKLSNTQCINNLPLLLRWSPYSTEAELLKQFDDVGQHGTKVIIFSLWYTDDGQMELDFESDPEDIRISEVANTNKKSARMMVASEQHLANRLRFSLRGTVVTAIGFLKEAPLVNIHGFNVYHKNRLILPFWHVVSYSDSRGRGVVGVLEANFIQPTHNKQDFEKTPVFQKLESRLKEMTREYWDYHCQLIGYQPRKARAMTFQASSDSGKNDGIYQPVQLTRDDLASDCNLQKGAPSKRKESNHLVEPDRVRRKVGIGANATVCNQENLRAGVATDELKSGEAANLIQENRKLQAQCLEFEKTVEELNLKAARLRVELGEARREHSRLLAEFKLVEKVKEEKSNAH